MPSSNDKDIAKFEENDVLKAIDKILKSDEVKGKFPTDKPFAVLLGGQPASGKTTIQKMQEQREPNIVVINGDEFRKRHPNFKEIQSVYGKDSVTYTQPFSNAVVESLIDRLSNEKYNLIIEGTLRNPDTQLGTCSMLKNKGYHVELHVMAVDKASSWQGTINRYNQMKALGQIPRATPKTSHDETVAKLPGNISKAYESKSFDRITLVNRSGKYLYDSRQTPEINPKDKLHQALHASDRQKQPVEKKSLKHSLKTYKQMADQHNANREKSLKGNMKNDPER